MKMENYRKLAAAILLYAKSDLDSAKKVLSRNPEAEIKKNTNERMRQARESKFLVTGINEPLTPEEQSRIRAKTRIDYLDRITEARAEMVECRNFLLLNSIWHQWLNLHPDQFKKVVDPAPKQA